MRTKGGVDYYVILLGLLRKEVSTTQNMPFVLVICLVTLAWITC